MSESVEVWIDPLARGGVESMAIDEWLLETSRTTRIRCYRWEPGWGSFGYFVADREAAALLGTKRRIRRWTGGGVVDHDHGWCYTLVAPAGSGLAHAGAGESFRRIHGALAAALEGAGFRIETAPPCQPVRGGDCFQQPVCHDLVDHAGSKVAGAGQRRTRIGLLHQGAVRVATAELGAELAASLSSSSRLVTIAPDAGRVAAIAARRYGRNGWNEGRRAAKSF